MGPIAGIDLGTTHSLIGVMDAGFPVLIANREGKRITPSVVHYPETGEPLVGAAAARLRAHDPENTIYSVKRWMGCRGGEEALETPYRVIGADGTPVQLGVRGRLVSPEAVSAEILKALRGDAEKALDTTVDHAVITVPAYFNDAQRTATKRAGELAGFTVERIINEPTAAALAYGLDKLEGRARVAVYDLGGGTFDISILELCDGVFQVLATHGNTRLGGDDIDNALVTWLLRQMPRPENVEAHRDRLARLREAALEAKHLLSEEATALVSLPFLCEDEAFECEVTRETLEQLARPIVQCTATHCQRALADARTEAGALDAVILVGGMTRMPLVRAMVTELFDREPDLSQNPDEAVALGATLQAGILSGAVRDVVLLDVTPLSLGIETFGGLMNVIIPRNSTIPIKRGELFTNAVSGQREMMIHVLQGERELARDNWTLGTFALEFEPAPKGQARVGVQFEIDVDGLLHVLARDTKTGHEKVVQMVSAVEVSDEAVEKMLEDSLEHAFEDMSERVFTEAKLKANEMLPAVAEALSAAGHLLSEEERQAIASAVETVRTEMESGGSHSLKRAVVTLDETTQRLATVLLEQAINNPPAKP
jgi:molecular chaperone DnaK